MSCVPPIGCSVDHLNTDRLDSILDRIREVRVLVVGDVMLDVYLRGRATRVSPEAPVPVVHVHEEWRALGGAANVAGNVVALGAACALVGCIGRDRAAQELREELDRVGIDRSGLQELDSRPTTVKTRILVRHQQVARYDLERDDDADEACIAALTAEVTKRAEDADAIILEDYNKGALVEAVIHAALEAGKRLGRPVVVDPKTRRFFDYVGATVFKPNRTELGVALNSPVQADDPAWLERTRRRLDCRHLLVTLGEEGISLMTEEGEFIRVPTVAREVYDVSGAGDTVTATVAVALAGGASVVEAAVLANYAAAIEVGKPGVVSVSADELRESVSRHRQD